MDDSRAGRLLAAFIVTGLFFLALPGTFIGVGNLLLIAASRAPTAPAPAWIQAHGQAQVFGWVGSFMFGISLFILPRFRGIALASLAWGWTMWALWTAGVALHWLGGVGDMPAHPWLVVSAVLELAAFIISQYLLVVAPARAARAGSGTLRVRPAGAARDLGTRLGMAGFCGLGLTLVVNLVAAIQVAPESAAYPPVLDHILLELSLWTFLLPIALGYSSRFVSMFLGLRPLHGTQVWQRGLRGFDLNRLLMLMVAALAIAILLQAWPAAAALALVFAATTVWALRIFEPPARPALLGGVYGGYAWFVRIAFVWLLIGAVIGLMASADPARSGLAGAGRHALTVGYIATLIFTMAPRLLPEFLHRRLASRALMAG
ncbi:MAG TPA: hypothetical protein VIC33_00255, partial [Vicinamibacterales bacterium]